MRQFIGMIGDDRTLGDFALSLAAPQLRAAGERLAAAGWPGRRGRPAQVAATGVAPVAGERA